MKTKNNLILNLMFALLMFGSSIFAQTDCNGFRTYTIGGWGTECSGGNPGCYRDANFAAAFPNGLTIGCGGNTLSLTSSAAVQAFLPSGTTPDLLPAGNMVDPGQSYSNVLAGQLVGVTLAAGFDAYDANFATNSSNLGSLMIASGTFQGMTVNDFLALANNVIGGCASGYSLADLNAAATAINENFDNGNTDNGYLACTPPLNVSIYIVTNSTCFGYNNATATVTINGGVQPYSIVWSNGETGMTAYNLSAGDVSATVTDAAGHSSSAYGTVTQPSQVMGALASSTNVSCFGGNDGSASITVSGGNGSYSVSWSNGASGTSISNLAAGSYTASITDGSGCMGSVVVVISQPSAISTSSSVNNVSCNGGSNGSATVTANGGTAPYSIYWAIGMNTWTVSGLAAGSYNYTVTDANGCQKTGSVSVSQPSALSLSIVKTDVDCYGGTGTATANVTGGTAPYTYSWNSNPVQTEATADLGVGTWMVTVTDANGCSVSGNVTLTLTSCQGFTTVTLGGWGAKCAGGNWGCYRDANFASSFPNGLTIGACGRYITLTNSAAVQKFLPSTGTPRALNVGTMTNPSNYGNTLAGQMVALTLNVKFDLTNANFSSSATNLGNLIMANGMFAGWTVNQILAEANKALGACSTYNCNDLNNAINNINRNYDNGISNLGYLACPCQARSMSSFTEIEADGVVGSEIVAFSSYPNPFKDEAKIQYTLNYDSKVNIEVYNISGQLVDNIFNGYASANQNYIVVFNAETYKAGVYFVKLVTEQKTQTTKVMIMNK
jgi:SprB repeat/Secretion system C-terminal sorting domain